MGSALPPNLDWETFESAEDGISLSVPEDTWDPANVSIEEAEYKRKSTGFTDWLIATEQRDEIKNTKSCDTLKNAYLPMDTTRESLCEVLVRGDGIPMISAVGYPQEFEKEQSLQTFIFALRPEKVSIFRNLLTLEPATGSGTLTLQDNTMDRNMAILKEIAARMRFTPAP